MSFRPQFYRFFVAVLILTTSLPLLAAGKRRAVEPLRQGTLRGQVLDIETSKPVAFALVSSGDQRTEANAEGRFEILVGQGRQTSIDVSRSGYTSTSQPVTPSSQEVTVRLRGLPTVTIRTTAGLTYQVDFDSAQFAYLVPFSSYAKLDAAKLCKPDGSAFRPDRSIIKRITGPATSVDFAPCCTRGPALKINVELKDGTKTDAYFVDSCFGYEMDFIAREHVGGEFLFLKFVDIAEIVFP